MNTPRAAGPFPRSIWSRVASVALRAYIVYACAQLEVSWEGVLIGMDNGDDIFARMFPPDFERWELLVKGMTESLQMAFAATLVGIVLSIPLGIAAARNLAPRPVYLAARGTIVVGRTFHEVIIAIFFVKLFSF
ncbi:MAG TPA: hypothetical protein PKW35_18310, partial [Nannocystaceae bacterium]|nr:hypothetical protein [Nannocystaceae bacterium]